MKTRTLFALLALAFIVQTAHHAEHVAQLIQIYAFAFKPPEAHGLLGSVFDFEWVHFLYNLSLEAMLVQLWLGYRGARKADPTSVSRRGLGMLTGVMLFQGYHSVEHMVKLYQYLLVPFYQFGLRPTPGFLPLVTGWPIFLVHFGFNMIVWATMALALGSLRPPGLRRATIAAIERLPIPTSLAKLTSALALLTCLAYGGAALYQRAFTLHVPGDYSTLQAAIEAAPRTATILIAPGEYSGPFTIRNSLTVRAAQPGTALLYGSDSDPVVSIHGTHDVSLQGLMIAGGYYGLLVEESEAVTLSDNRIVGAWLAAIRLSRAQARIVGNDVRDTRSPYGKGIELANTHSRPESIIAYNTVTGHSREGILLHNAAAELVGNQVSDNDLYGIAITEMSMATVQGNTMMNNADAGLYVVDMSMADVVKNHISATRPGPLGWAHTIRVEYYAEARLDGNQLQGGADSIVVWQNATVVDAVPP